MALKSVDIMVKNRLSFVPQTGWETLISDFETEQMYYLDIYLKKSEKDPPEDIEDEDNWVGVERLLLAEITTYQVLTQEIVKTIGGDADASTKVGAGSKKIKSAKADVVEAEFEYAKSEDGQTLALKCRELIPVLEQSICRYAQALGFYLPGYCKNIPKTNPQPPFIITNPYIFEL